MRDGRDHATRTATTAASTCRPARYKASATLDGFATATAERAPAARLGADRQLHAAAGHGGRDHHRHRRQVPVVEVTNTAAGDDHPDRADRGAADRRPRLQAPGAADARRPASTPSAATWPISGQRGINTNVTVDGVDFNNAFFGGTVGGAEGRAPLSISQESIKEFTVITNGASVEFGRSGGGFVNVITKSGTNNLHGSLFYYNQPQSTDRRTSPTAPSRADQEKEQYGGSLGGAIIQDKLFYFVSYDEQEAAVTIPIVPAVLDPAIFARYPVLASRRTRTSRRRDGDVAFGRLDFQATHAHRFMAARQLHRLRGRSTAPRARRQPHRELQRRRGARHRGLRRLLVGRVRSEPPQRHSTSTTSPRTRRARTRA